MRKSYCVLLALFLTARLFSNKYKIEQTTIKTNPASLQLFGTTQVSSVEREIPINYLKIFESEEELIEYIEDYKLRLYNTRAFEQISVDYFIEEPSNEEDLYLVTLNVELKDSIHVLGMPYIKYNSNTGSNLKIKLKDTNFLGTLNTMSSELNFKIEQKNEFDKPKYNFGLVFEYDQPFSVDPFEITWVNKYSLSYTIGNEMPEWNAKTGVKVELPFDKFSYILEFYQYFINNYDYKDYSDSMYFTEEGKFSVPITIYDTTHWGALIWKPYISAVYNWDFGRINENNTDLSSPSSCIGNSIGIGRINWDGNFRIGYDVTLTNDYTYNFQRKMFYPWISFEGLLYQNYELFEGNTFNKIGLCCDFYYFVNFVNNVYKDNPFFKNDGKEIGSRLRGIRDNQIYAGSSLGKATLTTSAFVLNLDFPYHIFSTNFQHRIFKYFNFDLQLSPFIDIALCYNKFTKQWYNPKDGFYAAGLEILVFPKKFSSYTVRASVGYDIGRQFFDKWLNMDWRENVSKYEISLGLGLHY